MTDHQLAAAITRRLREEGHPDPARLAAEILVMVNGHGYRPVEALRPVAEARPSGGPTEEWKRERAAMRARRAERARA